MKKHVIVTIGVASLALALAGCGGSSSTNTASQYVAAPNVKAKVLGSFGGPMVLPNGIKYTISTLVAFIPGQFASGQIPGQVYQSFNISVINGSKSSLDLSSLIVQGNTAAGNCADIFDGDNKVDGAPQTPLAVGENLTFKWALTCPGKVGDKFDLILSVTGVNDVQASGKLA
jgi:hypothetical protein